ncbi:MAG: hypothetical protein JWR88_1043 [Pseudonocardia sp.]|nr:hypothetical protein [Pseudonocardia sp.]
METTSQTAATVTAMPLDRPTVAKLKQTGRALSRAEQAVDRAREDRDATVRQAAAAGGTVREIAEHLGLSATAVHKIVRREQP